VTLAALRAPRRQFDVHSSAHGARNLDNSPVRDATSSTLRQASRLSSCNLCSRAPPAQQARLALRWRIILPLGTMVPSLTKWLPARCCPKAARVPAACTAAESQACKQTGRPRAVEHGNCAWLGPPAPGASFNRAWASASRARHGAELHREGRPAAARGRGPPPRSRQRPAHGACRPAV